jgi:tetratricopeptide (TPR) repeat protein
MALLWSEQFGPAVANALQALEINPNYVQAKAYLAEAYWRLDRDDLAVPTINEAVENLRAAGAASPETIAMVFRTQGYIAERRLDRETAIEAYERAREAAPTHSYIALELALSYFGAGQVDEAVDLLNQALDSNPGDTALMFQLGKIYINIGNAEESRQVLQRCVEADPNFPGCLSWLGGLQFGQGNYPQAITSLERTIDNGSEDPDDWWQLGRSHTFMLRCDLAVPILREGYQRVEGNVELEARFATGLRDCGAEVIDDSILNVPTAILPGDVTPADFFTATPAP